jgi:sugar (pentulose or hexulose) kinase
MAQKVTAVFDIGKTNKKFFLFDVHFDQVYRAYTVIPEIEDEDGHPTEDLNALTHWVKDTFETIWNTGKYEIESLNFSTYGASMVHLDADGNVLGPLYNYTKPIPEKFINQFYAAYGPENLFFRVTGSSNSGMLNAGMQLYWLKNAHPSRFKKIDCSLHLPQYLSYLFSGKRFSEYTSIGCHTALWNYKEKRYHEWVQKEGIDKKLPEIVATSHTEIIQYKGKELKIGVGIHDSSSALLPYIQGSENEFVLLSTGTWSIALNPFSEGVLTADDIEADCINYMRIHGDAVKASRLFLGYEFTYQSNRLAAHFGISKEDHKNIAFNELLYQKIRQNFQPKFKWKNLDVSTDIKESSCEFNSFEEGYHQLLFELIKIQVERINTTICAQKLKHLYIDGGFAANKVFVEILGRMLPGKIIKTADSSLGSALGAALVIQKNKLVPDFLSKQYGLKTLKYKPIEHERP